MPSPQAAICSPFGEAIAGQTVHCGVRHPDVQTSRCKVSTANVVREHRAAWQSLLSSCHFFGTKPFHLHHAHHSCEYVSGRRSWSSRPQCRVAEHAMGMSLLGTNLPHLQTLWSHNVCADVLTSCGAVCRSKPTMLVVELSFFWHKSCSFAPWLYLYTSVRMSMFM